MKCEYEKENHIRRNCILCHCCCIITIVEEIYDGERKSASSIAHHLGEEEGRGEERGDKRRGQEKRRGEEKRKRERGG